LESGNIPIVATDHSPAPLDMKTSSNFFSVWGGISGCQTLLQLLLTEGHHQRRLPLTLIAAVTTENVAERFRIAPDKGSLAIGSDADLALVDLERMILLAQQDLFYRHQFSPYIGRQLRGTIVRTLVRGQTVFLDGKPVGEPRGHLLKPSAH
jgi:allantoinase